MLVPRQRKSNSWSVVRDIRLFARFGVADFVDSRKNLEFAAKGLQWRTISHVLRNCFRREKGFRLSELDASGRPDYSSHRRDPEETGWRRAGSGRNRFVSGLIHPRRYSGLSSF